MNAQPKLGLGWTAPQGSARTLLHSFFLLLIQKEHISGVTSLTKCGYMSSQKDLVRKRRDKDQILTAIRARRFTGLETLIIGLELSKTALEAVGARRDD